MSTKLHFLHVGVIFSFLFYLSILLFLLVGLLLRAMRTPRFGFWLGIARTLCMSRSTPPNIDPSLVICGPSGVGKGTIISGLLSSHPDLLELSVSHTTRQPRPGEIDGVHYHFIKKDEMLKLTSTKFYFIENASVHGNLYGTSYDAVKAVQSKGKLCVLDIDTTGVANIKLKQFPAKYVFIAPPSVEALKLRLLKRKTESEEQMAIRLGNAAKEIEYGTSGNFDLVVVNEKLETSIELINSHLLKWFPKLFQNSTV